MPLFLFKVRPEGLSHPDWQASTECMDCLLNSTGVEQAVRIMVRETLIATPKPPLGQPIASSPWRNRELVDIIEVPVGTKSSIPEGVPVFDKQETSDLVGKYLRSYA